MQHRSTKLVRRTALAILIMVTALTAPQVRADSSWVTSGDLVAAILQTRTFTAQQLSELDLNTDGSIDVLDLVCFVRHCWTFPNAQFAEQSATVDEGAGTVNATIYLSTSYTGTLYYSLTTTGAAGTDFTLPPNCSLDAANSSGGFTQYQCTSLINGSGIALIPLALINNAVASQPIRTVALQISTGSGYNVGALNLFQLNITDNDLTWYGNLEDDQGRVGFSLSLVNTSGNIASGSLVSDGNGTFPNGTYAATITSSPTVFTAAVVPIPFPDTTTGLGVAFKRQLSLSANSALAGQIVAADAMSGTFTETLTAVDPANQYLFNAPITGTFTLIRGLPAPSTTEPPLQ